MRTFVMRGLAALAIALVSAGAAAADDFQAALARHFAAVSNRNMAELEATITAGPDLVLILPNATRTTTREDFVAFHKDFFADKTWTMRFEPVSTIVAGDMAVASVRTRWEGDDAGKRIWSESWLTLVFRREAHGWSLVHDQNTRIRTGP